MVFEAPCLSSPLAPISIAPPAKERQPGQFFGSILVPETGPPCGPKHGTTTIAWYQKAGPFSGPRIGTKNLADLRPRIIPKRSDWQAFFAPVFCRNAGLLVQLGPKSDMKKVPFSGPRRHCKPLTLWSRFREHHGPKQMTFRMVFEAPCLSSPLAPISIAPPAKERQPGQFFGSILVPETGPPCGPKHGTTTIAWYQKAGPFSGPRIGTKNLADLRPRIIPKRSDWQAFFAPVFCRNAGLLVQLGPKSDMKKVPFSGPRRHCKPHVAPHCLHKSGPFSGPISGTTFPPRMATPI